MILPNLIPNMDPNPLPAPYWVFKLLLVVTFVLHILAMNFMLGGGLVALLARWRAKNPGFGHRVFFEVAKRMPVFLRRPSPSALRRCFSCRFSTDSSFTPRRS